MPSKEQERPDFSSPGPGQGQPPSPQDRAVSQALATLEQSVAAIQDSGGFRAYLTAQARFHAYSWGNVLLILAQRPDATRVAGFQTWKRLGRHVRTGEHGLRIIVPRGSARVAMDDLPPTDPFRGDDEPEAFPATIPSPTSVGDRARIIGARRFGVGTVFDVSQTEGEPLPAVDVPVLEGEDGLELYGRLGRVATDEGLTIERGSERLGPSTMGFYRLSHVSGYVSVQHRWQPVYPEDPLVRIVAPGMGRIRGWPATNERNSRPLMTGTSSSFSVTGRSSSAMS